MLSISRKCIQRCEAQCCISFVSYPVCVCACVGSFGWDNWDVRVRDGSGRAVYSHEKECCTQRQKQYTQAYGKNLHKTIKSEMVFDE